MSAAPPTVKWPDAYAAPAMVAVWGTCRMIMAAVWFGRSWYIVADVAYYAQQLGADGTHGLREYPTPVVWLLWGLFQAAGRDPARFFHLFVVMMLVLDAITTALLWHLASRRAALYWTVFIALVGPLVWSRLDLVPACLVAWALLLVRRRPAAAGVALALGAAAKFWPALLIGPLLSGRDEPGRRARGFLVAGGAAALASLAIDGWSRTISPLVWQADRGLQIESVPATWLMLRHVVDPAVTVSYTVFNAYQVTGPGESAWLAVSSVLTVAAVALALVLGWIVGGGGAGWPGQDWRATRLVERQDDLAWARVTSAVAIVGAVIVANKTLSPQYVIWLAGPLALLAGQALDRPRRTAPLLLGALGLAVALATQQIYPLHYDGLTHNPGGAQVSALLAVRNLLLVVMTVVATIWAVRTGRRVGRSARRYNGRSRA
ncbi:MAG: hypothetical protein FWC46_02640 [Actinomycetia bacterium]|nr:hypothetical protein [Actinomycetes bacterium]